MKRARAPLLSDAYIASLAMLLLLLLPQRNLCFLPLQNLL